MKSSIRVTARVNGEEHTRVVEPRLLLSDFLRHELGFTGTHVGCEHGVCGACTVLVDGAPVRACLMLAVQIEGHDVVTVEGLATAPATRTPATPAADATLADAPRGSSGALHPVQRAFHESHALQCGFCTPGILMTAIAFLAENPTPTRREIREALSGHLCRCTGYHNIVEGVVLAAEQMADAAESMAGEG